MRHARVRWQAETQRSLENPKLDLEKAVREQLDYELRGNEPMDRIRKIVQWVVREELDLDIGSTAALRGHVQPR